MSVDNLLLPSLINRRKSSDDAHLLIGRALGETIRREDITESYVVSPPALYITDDDGATFMLGHDYTEHWRAGACVYEWMVMRNDRPTGQFATHIEYRRSSGTAGIVTIFGCDGKRAWSRNKSSFI